MAALTKKLTNNAPGEFFVDSTCINCDTCRQLAPAVFGEANDFSYVRAQPEDADTRRAALRALIACPTGSIGAACKTDVRSVVRDFPLPLAQDVYYCGFNSPKSYGGNSYFVRHPGGNWLIDSPRWVDYLAGRFEELGGVAFIFLTHRDDVADAEEYAKRFGSQRIIHRLELSAQPGAERVLEGREALQLAPEFLAVPTPGHTRGHMVLLYRNQFLFAGDHLWWSRERGRLNASRSVCWYSWPQQTESMATLAAYSFEWVLPGHGERVRLPAAEMSRQMRRLAELMRQAA
jgi:glyoxylase-like metal-dependent hydrolase (beta-lactamase superfamily II)/ferredoxin